MPERTPSVSFERNKRALEAVEVTLSAIGEIEGFIAEVFSSRFRAAGKLMLAVTHLVQIIGEVTKDMADGIEDRQPGIPWRQVRDMRYRIAHEYLSVDFRMVWDVATTDLAPLRLAQIAERDYLTSC
ncbi:MAG: DUF86 domain-containing protein [Phaeospirillum sp.]|nr:DUF86 domain-containing protein [Phaeospirillum sp.]